MSLDVYFLIATLFIKLIPYYHFYVFNLLILKLNVSHLKPIFITKIEIAFDFPTIERCVYFHYSIRIMSEM
jgi:hypothetical protein